MSPIFAELANDLNGKVDFVKVNSDEHGEEVNRYQVKGLPFFALFHNGKLLSTHTGAVRKEGLKAFIDSALEKNSKA